VNASIVQTDITDNFDIYFHHNQLRQVYPSTILERLPFNAKYTKLPRTSTLLQSNVECAARSIC
jgi:hypothetical protein